ncbi:unnamed protein product [Penicillium glandicola]
MSSSAAMSIRKSGTRVVRPSLSQLVATHTSSRSMWRCTRNGQEDKAERIARGLDKSQRYPLYSRRKPDTRYDNNATPNDTHSRWSWATWLPQSSFSNFPAGWETTLWDSDSRKIHKHMEVLKKYIEADPYKAIFGRRLDPFQNFGRKDTSLNAFFQSLSSMEKPPDVRPRVDKRQTRSDANHIGLQYDPISGRMAPIPPSIAPESSNTEAEINSNKTVDCPQGTEVEAKFAHSPGLVEDRQFQPGNTGLSPHVPSSSQSTVNCPPESELDSLFSSTPISQDVQDMAQVPQENKQTPYVNTDCPPGSELETLFVSESIPSIQPQPDTSKANENTNKLNLDASFTAGTKLESPPGSELEAKCMFDPVSHSAQNSPSGLETKSSDKQLDVSIDCPPGNELDAKLSSELLVDLGIESDGPVHPEINTNAMTGAQEIFECSPGSEIEAQILSESASHDTAQSGAQTSVDCSPGGEPEAKFICNPASIEEEQSKPELPASLGTSKIAKNVVDCTPGNELEAKFTSEMTSAEIPYENEDLSPLDASDIRSRYPHLSSKGHTNSLDFDASEDRVDDIILHEQNLATEKGEQPKASQKPSPKFHILALDVSTSQVTAAQADSFFGVDEDSRPSEILSRLHNPAKFLPYFQKFQEDGYEIATGGGNILVFRKTQNVPSHTLANTATDQEPAIHAEIANHLHHDSKDSATTYPGASWKSTTEPPSVTGSSSSKAEPTTQSESSFLKTGRRILIAGTATAATCYAIGAITEFFRTGGKDGHGIDAFTAFESDRRRE